MSERAEVAWRRVSDDMFAPGLDTLATKRAHRIGGEESWSNFGGMEMHDKASASKGLILVVEPDELIRGLLERWLIEAGHGVEAHGADPGDLGRTPALVILDIVRPRDATATVRLFKERHGAPVMAISARFRRGLQTSSDAAARLGARALLAKPFTRDELFEAVERALRP